MLNCAELTEQQPRPVQADRQLRPRVMFQTTTAMMKQKSRVFVLPKAAALGSHDIMPFFRLTATWIQRFGGSAGMLVGYLICLGAVRCGRHVWGPLW